MTTSTEGPRTRILVASNRGPLSFARDEDDRVVATRGVGGLVTALTGALEGSGGLWVAAAMSEEDRIQAERGPLAVAAEGGSFTVRYLAFDPVEYDRFYNGVSNRILWFVHHYLWDVVRGPRFGPGARIAWEAYRRVNHAFADALDAEGRTATDDPVFLIQDYHLALVPSLLRERRPDASIAHFSHIPFAGPGYFRILPEALRTDLLSGLLGADILGFHATRWAENFLMCCRALRGARVDLRRRRVRWGGRTVRVGVYPIGVDAAGIESVARSRDAAAARRRLARRMGDTKMILRVDRVELSKNLLRGLVAFEQLLARRPAWRGKVRMLAMMTPSRESIPEYRAYLAECRRSVGRINRRFGDEAWRPIELRVKDDWHEALAAYSLYDVLLVNPVFDGMNLVAKEGPLLNRRDGVLVLSENAGAFDQLGPNVVPVNPFDVAGTADALEAALTMEANERARRARALRRTVRRATLDRWVAAQLRDLDAARGRR